MNIDEARQTATELYEKGLIAFRRGDEAESRALNEKALSLGEEYQDGVSIVRALIGLSRIAFRTGDHARLRDLCKRAMPIWEALEDRSVVTSPIHMLAESARLEGNLPQARILYDRSIAASHAANDVEFESMELLNSSFLELQAGDLVKAKHHVRASVSTSPPGTMSPYVLLALGGIAARTGDARGAASSLARAEAILEASSEVFDPGDKPLFDSSVAEVRRVLGDDFDAAWLEGANMTTEDALIRALGD